MKASLLTALLVTLVSTSVYAAKTNAEQHQTFDADTKFQDRTESVEYKTATATPKNLSEDHTFEPGQFSTRGLELGAGWIATGDLRLGWVQYDYNNPPPGDSTINRGHVDSKGFYTVAKLAIKTPELYGFSAKVMAAGATDFGLNDPAYESRNFVFNGADPKSYGILQEAYIKYQQNDNTALIGRQELTTPMVDADDWYMFANSFELAYYANTMLENNLFAFGYFYKMAGVWDSGAYDANVAPLGGTKFYSMSQASFASQEDKDNADDAGIITGAYQYDDDTNNVQVWNYYASDLYNTFFLQYDFKSKVGGFSYDLGAQFINWKEVGKLADNAEIDRAGGNTGRSIDASLYSVRFDGSFENGINFATGAAKYSDGDGFGTVLGAWGGYPYFANGMIFHFFEAGTLQNAASYKAQLGYDILDGLWVGGRFTYWDLDPTKSISSSTGQGQDAMSMYGVRLSYAGVAGTYFTGTYEFVDLDQQPDISSLRLIGGIKF